MTSISAGHLHDAFEGGVDGGGALVDDCVPRGRGRAGRLAAMRRRLHLLLRLPLAAPAASVQGLSGRLDSHFAAVRRCVYLLLRLALAALAGRETIVS